ncbi:MAG: polyamine ABC transporter substrate-binding protein [Treponema sp.]|nr:polyamine ABC transporter substrate-binding protein [Treponema sp.]
MRKSMLLAAGLLLIMGTSLFAAGRGQRGQTLSISHWGFNMDLLERNLIIPFEERYGVTVVMETGNNADRLTRLAARRNNPNVDVVFFASNFAFQAMNEGLLAPYDPAKIPNLARIIPAAVDPLGGRYAIGFAVTHMGLFHRTDRTAPITSWRDLFRPELYNQISIPGIHTTFGPGVIYMLSKAFGSGFHDTETGWSVLAELAPRLKTAYNNAAELNSLITQEEVYAAPFSSFAWGQIEATGHPVASVIPEEGLVGTYNVVSIVNGSPNVELAHAFINFLLSQEVQLAQAMDLVDSPVNLDVRLPAHIGSRLTYGEELINSLFFHDEAEVDRNRANWIARWNAIFAGL